MLKDYPLRILEKTLNNINPDYINRLAFQYPKVAEHGDLSTNIAMQLTKELKNAPPKIAEDIISNLDIDIELVSEVSIAGPGFINFKFTPKYFALILSDIISKGNNYGKSFIGENKNVNVEYVSVNPTGLLHLGHGRNASIGDTVSNLFEWLGYNVTREYYFNNAGNQMNNLAKSIYARYIQLVSDESFPFPEDGYHGEYVREIAEAYRNENGIHTIENTEENLFSFRKFGELWCFEKIKQTLSRMKIRQDVYYNEDSLYSDGKIDEVISELTEKGLVYDKDGAKWLALSNMGLEDDRVIVKSTGEPTYRLPDIAYHREKFKRGFDIIVDIFGSDHVATIPDVMAAQKALGFDTDKIKVIIHQFVTLTENGEQVKMSKRTGKSYTLDDLLDEVGPEVVRFFLIMRGVNTHLEFDLDLAREQSEKNPVFYLQYAHARISSILDNVKEQSIEINPDPDLSVLKHQAEQNLIKNLALFPEVIENAGQKAEPQVLSEYLRDLAATFHTFYHDCRIIGSEDSLLQARIALAAATQTTLRNGLSILGISSPDRM